MARGIITTKPGTGSAGSAGKIIVTEGKTDGGGTTPITATYEIGSVVDYTKSNGENIGDLVDFNFDSSGVVAVDAIVKTGTVITSSQQNLVVNSGEAVMVNGSVEGKVTVNGGVLTIVDGSRIGGKVESTSAGSFILTRKATIEAKVEMTGQGYLSLENTTVEGKVNSDGTAFTRVNNCTINGSLTVINSSNCQCSGNTVSGTVNTTCP